jgi:SAM-dependent methyltransferase
MRKALYEAALRLPLIGPMVRKQYVWRARLRALLGPLNGQSEKSRLEALRRDVGQLLRLSPVFVARDRQGFLEASRRAQLPDFLRVHLEALKAHEHGSFHLRRFCLCCNETTPMLVDYQYGRVEQDGSRTPNWRERLVCGHCGMNNRQRLMAKLVQQAALESDQPKIYLMEQVTPIYEWVKGLPGTQVHGSEYLGYQYKGGDQVNGVRHEDVMNLSYPEGSFDLIVSNDVMEHIPDPERAFAECLRVLKPGGSVLATFPFYPANDTTVVRARLVGNDVEHLLPPQYHGNPVSSDGSLVFQDFGWDLLQVMTRVGFSSAVCEWYSSDEFGHLGAGLLVFRLRKSEAFPTQLPQL